MIKNNNFLFVYILILLSGCEYGSNAVNLPLEVEIKNNDICLYTKYKKSFLNEDDENDWFMVYASRSDNTKEKNYEKKIILKEHKFPYTKEDCILIPIHKLSLNKPYGFSIDTGKNFFSRACVIRERNEYKIKKVHSIENCD